MDIDKNTDEQIKTLKIKLQHMKESMVDINYDITYIHRKVNEYIYDLEEIDIDDLQQKMKKLNI